MNNPNLPEVARQQPNRGYRVIGTLVTLFTRPTDQRGLSQSTENAVLLVGAIAIAGVVITLVGGYVARQLGVLG